MYFRRQHKKHEPEPQILCNVRVKTLQTGKATIRKKIGIYKSIQFGALVMSSILVLLGTVYLYQYENLRDKLMKSK